MYLEYKNYMYGVCLRYARNEDQALEFFQEGFINVFQSLNSFNGQSTLKTWMARIFVNTAVSILRKERKHLENLRLEVIVNQHSEDTLEDNINDEADHWMDAEMVLEIIKQLPENYRLVLNLYAIDGLSHAKIAEILQIGESHSRVLLTRARKKLNQLLIKKNLETNVTKNG